MLSSITNAATKAIINFLNLPVSKESENAINVIIGTCWNNVNNKSDENGQAHRGTFAQMIIQIVRVNGGQSHGIPLDQLVVVAGLLDTEYEKHLEKSRLEMQARREAMRASWLAKYNKVNV